jgi:hypothetical protein
MGVYKAKAAMLFSPQRWSSLSPLCVRFVVQSDTGIWYPWPGVLCLASYRSPIWTSHQNPSFSLCLDLSPSLSCACACMDGWEGQRDMQDIAACMPSSFASSWKMSVLGHMQWCSPRRWKDREANQSIILSSLDTDLYTNAWAAWEKRTSTLD